MQDKTNYMKISITLIITSCISLLLLGQNNENIINSNSKHGKKYKTKVVRGFDEYKDFDFKWIKVKKNNKYGLIDSIGKEILPVQYDYISGVFNGMFLVQKYEENNTRRIKECSLINSSGNILLHSDENNGYNNNSILGFYINGLVTVKINDSVALYSSAGQLLPPIYKSIIVYYDKWVVAINKEDKYELYTVEGNKIDSYDYLQFIEQDTARILSGKKIGYMNFETGDFIQEDKIQDEMNKLKIIYKKRPIEILNGNSYDIKIPNFPLGFTSAMTKKLEFPYKLIEDNINDVRVILKFIVNSKGEISSVFVKSNLILIGDGMEENAIKAIYGTRSLKWDLATIDGLPVDLYFRSPIIFRFPVEKNE